MPSLRTAEIFPAGHGDIVSRMITLSTGVRVRIAESGAADGVPVIMLHGWGASLYMFRDALRMLPAFGIRAIAVDLRGHGLSDHPREPRAYSLDAYLADLDALLHALEFERVALIGQSMGGAIALHFALRWPDRVTRLALINPVGLVPIGWVGAMRGVPAWFMDRLGGRLIPRWLTGLILRHLAYGERSCVSERDVDEYWTTSQVPGFAHAIRAGIAEFDWAPLSPSVAASLAIPTVVIVGTRDRVVRRSRAAAERLRGAHVVAVSGGHCVHEERPEEVYGVLGKFLTTGSAI